jgi:L-xylulokinase
MDNYLIGLDNGGTLIKAIVFDTKGNALACASAKTPIITPESGYTERDIEELWLKNCDCVKRALAEYKVDGSKVVGLAISGHGKGLYLWGQEDKPIYSGIVSTDNRAWRYPEKWKQDGTFDRNYPKLCQNLMACQQLSLLAWMKDNRPGVYDSIRWVFSVKDYLRFRLTGEAYCEATDISGSGLMNVRDKKFDQEMLEDFGIGEMFQCLAPIRYSSDHCGGLTKEAAELTGLPEGMPVAGGMFDIDACAIAMSVLAPEDMITIAGTWSINEYISQEPVLNKDDIMMNSLYAIPGYYLIEECSATSAGNLEWYIDNILSEADIPAGQNAYAYIEEKIQTTDTEKSDVYFLPFLYASNTHPLGKASFIGLTLYHGQADMLRAIFEGVVFSHKMHIERLIATRKVPESIRLAGGVTKSPFWTQMFADILNYPLELVKVKELGALGAAMAAGVSGGIFKDYYEAATQMTSIDKVVQPNLEMHAKYQKKYEKYCAVCSALNGVWNLFDK